MTDNKQQSVVSWFLKELIKDGYIKRIPVLQFQKAKAMEKEQIMKAISAGCRDGIFYVNGEQLIYKSPEQYYEENYGNDKQ
jgi:hypothetical protein